MKSMNAPQKIIKRRAYLRRSREIDEAEICEVEQTLEKAIIRLSKYVSDISQMRVAAKLANALARLRSTR